MIASAELTNEEQFLTGRIFRDGLGLSNLDFPARPQPPVVYPKFTIEGDKNPNTRGARLLAGTTGRGRSVADIIAAAAEGRIKVLLFMRGGRPETFGDAAMMSWTERPFPAGPARRRAPRVFGFRSPSIVN